MKSIVLAVGFLSLFLCASASAQLGNLLVARIGTKCLTALNGKVVASACTGNPDQIVATNFSVGGLQIGPSCLRRANTELTLAPCRSGDADEVFELNAATAELSNSNGRKVCADLSESAADWRPNEPVSLHPCLGTPNQKWSPATLKPTPGKGMRRQNDTLGEVQPNDYVPVNGQYVVIGSR